MQKEMPKTTHLFIKCLEYQFAKAFIDEGAIRFASKRPNLGPSLIWLR